MPFYPETIFSMAALGVGYIVMLLLYGIVWWLSGAMKARTAIRVVAALIFLLLPVSEELWIAWNFSRACESAGTYVERKVVVQGFYDTTRHTHAGPRNAGAARDLDRGGYHFYEMVLKDNTAGPKRIVHLEKSNQEWKATVLDHPTARYQYRTRSHIPIGWKVVAHESVVVDMQGEQVIGRERIVGRYAPWFYVGLDAPQVQCFGKRETQGLIYQSVLLPSRGQEAK